MKIETIDGPLPVNEYAPSGQKARARAIEAWNDEQRTGDIKNFLVAAETKFGEYLNRYHSTPQHWSSIAKHHYADFRNMNRWNRLIFAVVDRLERSKLVHRSGYRIWLTLGREKNINSPRLQNALNFSFKILLIK